MIIKECTCSHAYQDEKYGKNQRCFNKTLKGYRCTVCSKEKIKTGGSL